MPTTLEPKTYQPAPNVWKDSNAFISHFHPDRIKEFDERYGDQIEELKMKVKELLVAATDDVIGKIKLIDLLCHIFKSHHTLLDHNDYDLYTISLLFRIFRQHGYKMSTDYFNKFKDSDGNFKESLSNDGKGILSLYEATFLEVHGEDILVDALNFSKSHLKSLAKKSNPNLAKQIINALELPLHKSMPRFEALKFMSIYEQEESKNESLLLLAKLDFARVQLLHQKELNHLLIWWKDMNLPSKLPHIRDRVIEAYLWAALIYSEPLYSRARILLCKLTMLITIIDDTFDSYATYQEQKLLHYAIQRWDIKALNDLPKNMQIVYQILLDEFDQITNDLTPEEKSYRVPYMIIGVQKMFEGYYVEGEWIEQKYVPPVDEYWKNGIISAGSFGYTMSWFYGVDEEIADVNVFEWVLSHPKIVRAAFVIGRFKNDVCSHMRGEDRNHVLCGVECFMKEGLSMEEIIDKYNNTMAVNVWRDLNEEFMNPLSPVLKEVLIRAANMGRLMEVTYKNGDGYSYPEKLKDIMSMLFINPISI